MAILILALIPVNWNNAWPFAAFNLSKNVRSISFKFVGHCFELHLYISFFASFLEFLFSV